MSGSKAGTVPIKITATDFGVTAALTRVNRSIASLTAPAERVGLALQKFTDVSGIRRVGQVIGDVAQNSLQVVRSLERVAPSLGGIFASSLIGSVVTLSQRVAETGTAAAQLAYRLNAPVERLTALEGAARLAGSSAGDLDAGLSHLDERLRGAAFQRDPAAQLLFAQLGVSFGDMEHGARTATEALGDIAEAIKRLPTPQAQKRVVEELFGGDALLPMLRQGRAGIEELTKQATSLGAAITPEMAARSQELWRTYGELEIAVGGLARTIEDKLAPALSKFNDHLAAWVAHNRDLVASDVGGFVMKTVDALERFASWAERNPLWAAVIIGGYYGWKTSGWRGALWGGAVAPWAELLREHGGRVQIDPEFAQPPGHGFFIDWLLSLLPRRWGGTRAPQSRSGGRHSIVGTW
jgi:hypothetical protein